MKNSDPTFSRIPKACVSLDELFRRLHIADLRKKLDELFKQCEACNISAAKEANALDSCYVGSFWEKEGDLEMAATYLESAVRELKWQLDQKSAAHPIG